MRMLLFLCMLSLPAAGYERAADSVVLAVHGGFGPERAEAPPELLQKYRDGMTAALKAGRAALQKPGASGLDAVEAAIRVLEDDPLFNAGKGAVFTREGRNELDASIMEGKTKKAGAVAGVTVIKNPISAARAVMERSPHVMMAGRGAEVFATEQGLEIVDPAYFWTERRWKQLQTAWEKNKKKQGRLPGREWGTVGAVAIKDGSLYAGTSTGGMTDKRYGRIGDSPVIGAGTYADDAACAVSATGHGEYFIRWTVARDVCALAEYKRMRIEKAASEVLMGKLMPAGGEGGVIALDPKGRFAMTANCEGMVAGYVTKDGKIETLLGYD